MARSGESGSRGLKRRSAGYENKIMLDELDLPSLRAERRRLSERHDRLTWLRRLVKAREDLEVARLVGVCAPSAEDLPLPERVRAAIALQPIGPDGELLGDLVASKRLLAHAMDTTHEELARTQAELVRRYRLDPSSCLRSTSTDASTIAG